MPNHYVYGPARRLRRRDVALAVTLGAVLPTVGTPAAGQQVVRVDSAVACAACRIEVGTPIVFRGPFEDGALENLVYKLERDAQGRFYFTYDGDMRTIQVFSAEGRRTARRIGGPGEGPGKFRLVGRILIRGNVLHAFDPRLGRRTDFDLGTGEPIRTITAPRGTNLLLDDGRMVASGPVRTRESAGYPFHVYDKGGNWLRSFGLDEPVMRPDLSWMLNRRIVAAGPSTFWATRSNEYRVELWDADGRHLRTLVGERSWYKPWMTYVSGVRDAPPSTTMDRAAIDDDGLLWLDMSVAAENWRDAFGDREDMEGNAVLIPGKLYKRTIIEVVDPVEGKLLARRELPYYFTSFVAPGLLSHT